MESAKEQLAKSYKSFCQYMEYDTKGVEIGIYTVSGIIFAVAYKKIRPITKFKNAADIPNQFIKEKLKQTGVVKRIEPSTSGPILCVNHKPPINLFFFLNRTLPVKLAGVDINSNGYSWLQSVVVDHKILFVPIIKNENNAECQVLLVNPIKGRDNLDLAEALLSLGFAKTSPVPAQLNLSEDKKLARYFKCLNWIEGKAKKQRNGVWASIIPQPSWPVRTFNSSVSNVIYSLTPTSRKLPGLLR